MAVGSGHLARQGAVADRYCPGPRQPRPRTDGIASSQLNGTVELSVEIRYDASIGEIKVIKSLGLEIDQRCISHARQTIYLPAVNNRTFVTSWQNAKFEFFKAGWAK